MWGINNMVCFNVYELPVNKHCKTALQSYQMLHKKSVKGIYTELSTYVKNERATPKYSIN